MNSIPIKLKKQLSEDEYYKTCVRKNEECKGRITWEHAILYAGKQVQERFAIIPLCYYHHLGDGLKKAENIKIAMQRATEEDKKKYPGLS